MRGLHPPFCPMSGQRQANDDGWATRGTATCRFCSRNMYLLGHGRMPVHKGYGAIPPPTFVRVPRTVEAAA